MDLIIRDDKLIFFKVPSNCDVYLRGHYVLPTGDDLYLPCATCDAYQADKRTGTQVPKYWGTRNGRNVESEAGRNINACQQSRKRPVEDEGHDRVKFASDRADLVPIRQLKKRKMNDGKAATHHTGDSACKVKKVRFATELEQRATGSPDLEVQEKTELDVQRVIRGVTITDVKVGTGDTAEVGSKLYVHYIGKLENGYVFDNNLDGMSLTFLLGRGEVIEGWEVGLLGMRVGGLRRLVIPPALYGEQEIPGMPVGGVWNYECKSHFLLYLNSEC